MRGNTGAAPLKVLDEASLAAGGKRWRFASLKTRLQTTSARPTALPSIDFSSDIHADKQLDSSSSHFAAVLTTEAESNSTASFKTFYTQVEPLSISLPLVFRNRKKLIDACLEALQQGTRHEAEATVSIAKCLTAIFVDIGPQYLHPLFPRIISSFASVFSNTVFASKGNDYDSSPMSTTPSILWDPSNSLIPLFASIAEVTRLAIQTLILHPQQTVQSLLPLLAHSHYRIREMTAESCLGYLIRKTRNEQQLQLLTASVITAANSSQLDAEQQKCAAHGLGTSLFEAIRQPSGRLHSRATIIITAALRSLCTKPDPTTVDCAKTVDLRFSTLVTCFASLCRYVANEKDAKAIASIFVTSGEQLLSDAPSADVAKIICLLRNWIHFGGKNLSELLGLPFVQRILNLLPTCIDKFVHDFHVVFESLACMCSASRYTSSVFREKTCRSILSPMLKKIADSNARQSVKASLYVVLDVYKDEWDVSRLLALMDGISNLCDNMAQSEDQEGHDSPDVSRAQVSIPAISAALSFANLFDRLSDPQSLGVVRLKCTTLEAQILSMLEFCSERDPRWIPDISTKEEKVALRLVLQYLSRVIVQGSVQLLCTVAGTQDLCFEWRARFLRAICFQSLKTESENGTLLKTRVVKFMRNLISDVKETRAFSDVLQALDFFFRVSSDNLDVRKQLNQENFERVREKLIDNLSSPDHTVRILCAANLANICEVQNGTPRQESLLSRTADAEQCLAFGLEQLRKAFQAGDSDFQGLFDVMRSVFETSQEMKIISTKQKLVQEIARLVQNSPRVDGQLLQAVSRFGLGLLRTPLRLLWKDAKSLLRFAADRDEKLVMSILVKQLLVCKEEILDYCRSRNPESEEHVEIESDVAEGEAKMLPSFKEHSLTTEEDRNNSNIKTGSNRGSKRHRPGMSFQASIKKRKPSDCRALAKRWEDMSFADETLVSRFDETHVFRIYSCGYETVSTHVLTTDPPTFVVELVRGLCEEPKYSMRFRVDIISVYLSLDPSLFSQKRGATISLAFTNLLEKLGGLKSCETNTDLEDLMRSRLLSDLAMPNCELQAAVLRCLSVSRSPLIKPYRDSLIRLTQSKSFREELTLITEGMFSNPEEKASKSGENEVIVDLLTRICFSKIRGKWSNKDSQRFAVLSFLSSKLPWDIAFPKLISLVLKPLEHVVVVLEEDLGTDTSMLPMPNSVVQKAVLGSIEAIVRQCRMSLPTSAWKQLVIATVIIMRNAGIGPQGQSIRSRSLRICSDMHRIRPLETSFCIGRVMQTLRDAHFNTETSRVIQKTPALMQFVGAVMESDTMDGKEQIIQAHSWAIEYCFSVTKGTEVDVATVDIGLKIAKGFLSFYQYFSVPEPKLPPSCISNANHLLEMLSVMLQTLVLRLLDRADDGRKAVRTWTKTFTKSLEVLQMLSAFEMIDVHILVPVADALSTSLLSGDWHSSSTIMSLKALSAIAHRVKKNCGNDAFAIQGSILRLVPQISNSRFTNDSLAFSALCDLLSNTNLPDLVSACRILRSMYSMKSTELDSPDLDERIEALNELNAMLKKGMSAANTTIYIKNYTEEMKEAVLSEEYVPCGPNALIALFCGAFAAVRSNDIAVRGNAGYAIALMAKWIACYEFTGMKQLRIHVFESLIRGTVQSRDGDCRREYCRSLGEFVRCSNTSQENSDGDRLHVLPIMKDLSSSTDVNVDMFENLVHLQAHRRGRAIRDIEKCLSSFREGPSCANNQMGSQYKAFVKCFSLPLALNLALELVGQTDAQSRVAHMKGIQAKENSRRDVGVWAVSLAGESARLLDWDDYKNCLSDILRRLRNETREDVSGVLFKLLVKISEAYPRYEIESVEQAEISTYLSDVVLPRMLQCVTAGAVEGDIVDNSSKQAYQKRRPGATAFQAPVAVAIAQLMTRLPPTKMNVFIPLLVTPMTNALRSRLSGIRDAAKKALTSMVLILGPKYLGYVLQQVLSGLSEGFRRDNCVFVIYSVLSGILDDKRRETGRYSLDGIYDIVADFLVEELKGGIDETKKEYEDPNASVSRQRQSTFRAMKACECAQIISENITFQDHAEAFTKPYIDLLASAASSKLYHRVQECWRQIIIGFSRNSTMSVEDSFSFSYKLLSWEANGRIPRSADKDSERREEHRSLISSSVYSNRVSELGMQFLSSVLVKNWSTIMEKTESSKDIQAVLESFLPFIIKAMNCGRDNLTLVAFKVTQRMLKLPLAGRVQIGKSLSDTIVNVLSYGSNVISNTGIAETEDNLFLTCLRSAAVLLTEVGTKDFTVVSRERVEALIAICCECIDAGGPEVRAAALSVLRSLIARQVMIPKLYDAMEKVNHLAIHCQSQQLRDACTNIIVTFLVSFPLGSKRVRQQLEFFVRNLSYELPTGRLAALNAIRAVLNKFPGDVLERESEYLFVALGSMASQDVDIECRSSASQCLRLLFEKLPDGRKISDLLRMAITLSGLVLSHETGSRVKKTEGPIDPIIQRCGAVSLTAACMSGRLSTDHLSLIMHAAAVILPDLSNGNEWEAVHAFLLCVNEAFASCPLKGKQSLEVQPYVFPVWKALPSFLLSNHQWVRLSAARLLGRHLSSAGGGQVSIENLAGSSVIWSSNDLVRDILRSSCLQLEANILALELAKQTLENLICMADVLRKNPALGDLGNPTANESGSPRAEIVGEFEEGRALNWLIARMSGIASKGKLESSDILRRGCALRFLLVSTKRWDHETIRRHARQYINPVVRVLESGDIKLLTTDNSDTTGQARENNYAEDPSMVGNGVTGEGLRILAHTLQESLKEVLGSVEYFEVYSQLRNKRAEVKQSRKRNAALLAAIDPERVAKKRRKKSESRRRRKHKIQKQADSSRSAATQKSLLTEDL
eukprot:TRINITY_DN78049_c0_g1_i1.p1 TRINITY_DN78049_c0_g1~~TRINITY_DN78049_c0_g1_i1.p1  ORF type:complete len:2868 (+),score=361.76 TRINITY_DN78049_c0_g1_i1:150-8753(+)